MALEGTTQLQQTTPTQPTETTRGTDLFDPKMTLEHYIDMKMGFKQPIFEYKTKYEEEKTLGFSGSISYLVDLIIQLSKYVTKGRGLSKNGVNALLLFLLTAGLLYNYTERPTTLSGMLNIYSVPLIFLSYSIVDLAKKWEFIDRFFRRVGQRKEFTYKNIMDGNIHYEDLEYEISDIDFSYKQIIGIIKKLVDSNQFTPNAQNSLLLNNAIYRIDTLPLIKDSFIKSVYIKTTQEQELLEQGEKTNIETTPIDIKWTPSAVCIFLSKMHNNLTIEYLDKLIEKYKEFPSVLIAIGHFYQYKKGDDAYFKIGNEFKYTKNRTTIFKILSVSTFIILMLFLFLTFNLPFDVKQSYNFYLYVIIVLIIISLLVYNYVEKNDFIWSFNSHFKNYDVVKDDFVISQIVNDLSESF